MVLFDSWFPEYGPRNGGGLHDRAKEPVQQPWHSTRNEGLATLPAKGEAHPEGPNQLFHHPGTATRFRSSECSRLTYSGTGEFARCRVAVVIGSSSIWSINRWL